ncbi:enolase [Methylobacterium oryzisoli]|uniref:enolase n=1 Tax=Methylobacterium oryzisoli TaxID=3385502 RepID=UPI003891F7AD
MPGLAIRLGAVALFERGMRFTHPFRFGVARVEAAPQAFARVEILSEGGEAVGAAAEMMMPKWFDKNPAKSPEDTVADLRASLLHAAALYREAGAGARTPFGLHAECLPGQVAWARARGLPALVAAYGPALIDRAILDGALRLAGTGLAEGLRSNLPGLDTRLTPDLPQDALDAVLARIAPLPAVALRHTIGLADDLDALDALLARSRPGFLKIKLSGAVGPDRARLAAILGLAARRVPDFRASLDANEGYDAAGLAALGDALTRDPALARHRDALLWIEQPLDRGATFSGPLAPLPLPAIIDEADGDYDAFPRALALGYRGTSIKGCKGVYKAILNAARAEVAGAIVSAEDLTCQAGLAVEQDTALAACLGIGHAERNGHHYVDGFGPAPAAEAAAFRAALPEFYAAFPGPGRAGAPSLPTAALLSGPGLSAGARPDWRAMTPLAPSPLAPSPLAPSAPQETAP